MPTGDGAPLTPEQIKGLDSALNLAEGIVIDVESIAKGGVDGTGCPPTFTVREYMQDMRNGRYSKQTGDDLVDHDATHKEDAGPKLEWQLYYLCQAVAAKNAGACAEADFIKPKTLHKDVNYKDGLQDPGAMSTEAALAMQASQSYQGKCANAYAQVRAVSAFLSRAPDFLEVCRESIPKLAELRSPAAAEPMCRAWRDYNGSAEPFLQAIQTGVAHPLKREYALGVIREMTAAPGACAGVEHAYFKRVCGEMEDYKRALAARTPGACRGGICKVLMGEGLLSCEGYAKSFRTSACDLAYRDSFLTSREGTFKSYADQIEKTLASSDAGIGNARALKEFNARLDRLYDLRARFDAAAEEISPKSVKKGSPAGKGT